MSRRGSVEFTARMAGGSPDSRAELEAEVQSFFAEDVRVSVSSIAWEQIDVSTPGSAVPDTISGLCTVTGTASR
jgi:hypothetical protein